jgi:hypothetical protein
MINTPSRHYSSMLICEDPPNHAGEEALHLVAEQWTGETDSTAAGPESESCSPAKSSEIVDHDQLSVDHDQITGREVLQYSVDGWPGTADHYARHLSESKDKRGPKAAASAVRDGCIGYDASRQEGSGFATPRARIATTG